MPVPCLAMICGRQQSANGPPMTAHDHQPLLISLENGYPPIKRIDPSPHGLGRFTGRANTRPVLDGTTIIYARVLVDKNLVQPLPHYQSDAHSGTRVSALSHLSNTKTQQRT
jgi:hypothetical protein